MHEALGTGLTTNLATWQVCSVGNRVLFGVKLCVLELYEEMVKLGGPPVNKGGKEVRMSAGMKVRASVTNKVSGKGLRHLMNLKKSDNNKAKQVAREAREANAAANADAVETAVETAVTEVRIEVGEAILNIYRVLVGRLLKETDLAKVSKYVDVSDPDSPKWGEATE